MMWKHYSTVVGVLVAGWALAGSLDPTNGPAPTMHTLEEIYQQQADTDQKMGAFVSPQTLSSTTAVVHAGYYAATNLSQVDADLAAGNIKDGTTIFGVAGTAIAATGNASAPQVLEGSTFSTASATGLTGTMTNRGAVSITPGTSQQAIPQGYHNGSGAVAGDVSLVTANIKAGATIFGMPGAAAVIDTSAGNAAAADMLAGKTAYVNGVLITGNVAAGANLTGADGSLAIAITNGLYSGSKTATANDADLVTGNIRSGVNLFGVAGNAPIPSGNATVGQVLSGSIFSTASGTGLTGTLATVTLSADNATVAAGYYAATTLTAVETDLTAANIRTNATIFGIAGTYPGTTSGGSTYPALVPKTGQTNSLLTGDDGTYKKGVAWPNPRFTIQDDTNCVVDNLTGLMWARNANLAGTMSWTNAIDYCEGLTYGGTNDWRLPNLRELQSLCDYGLFSPALPTGHPFTGVGVGGQYWVSTTWATSTAYAWVVSTYQGIPVYDVKTFMYSVWPVCGGN